MHDSTLVAFYHGTGIDHRGRSIDDIHGFNLDELEFHHDYIQWLFPLPEPSGANASAPLLSQEDAAVFASDDALREALLKSFQLMLGFYGLEVTAETTGVEVRRTRDFDARSRVWLTGGNHNFLRISRILRSLTLLGREEYASALLKCLEGLYQERSRSIGATTMGYWHRAATKT